MENAKREVNTSDLTEEDIKALEETEFDETGKPVAPKEVEEDIEKEEDIESEVEEEVTPEPSTGKEVEIKDVQGETPRERALRYEVTRLKRERREAQTKNLIPKEDEVVDEKSMEELKELGYSEDEVKNLEKVIDTLATKKGYVKKDQTFQSMANDTLETFISEHSEYSPENDKDDLRWNRFLQVLKGDYNLKGKTQSQISSIFNKVHRDIVEEFGEVENKKNKVTAQKEKINVASVSTPAKGVSKTEPTGETPKKVGDKNYIVGGLNFKGFDDDDF